MKSKTDHLLLLRALACLAIIAYHVQYPGVRIEPIFGKNVSWIFSSSFMFVWIFFILSGFIIGKGFFRNKYTLDTKGVLAFYWNRFIRIAPLYYLVVFILYWVYGIYKTTPSRILWELLTFRAQRHPIMPLTGYLWYISVQFHLYVLAPLAFFAIRSFKNKHITVRLLLLIIISGIGFALRYLQFKEINPLAGVFYLPTIYSPTRFNIDLFVFGFALNTIFPIKEIRLFSEEHNKIIKIGMKLITWILMLCLFLRASYLTSVLENSFLKYRFDFIVILPLLFTIVTGIFILVFERDSYNQLIRYKKPILSVHPIQIAEWIGILSYPIYLLHPVVLNILRLQCFQGCRGLDFFSRYGVVLLLSSVLSLFIRIYLRPVVRMIRSNK